MKLPDDERASNSEKKNSKRLSFEDFLRKKVVSKFDLFLKI